MRQLNWVLPLLTALGYAALGLWLLPQLVQLAGGALPFDLRPLGYGLAEAQAYLGGLTTEGARFYLGSFRLVDTFSPILLALTLCLPLRGRGQFWFLPALAFGLFDLSENLAVARLIRLGPDIEMQAVALASGCTQAKFLTLAVALVLALYAAWQAFRDR